MFHPKQRPAGQLTLQDTILIGGKTYKVRSLKWDGNDILVVASRPNWGAIQLTLTTSESIETI